MSLETWAVAAVAIVDVEGSPLLLRTYTSPKDVLNSPAAPLHAHLYVGPEDIIKLHFVLFASLDRCEELRETTVLAKEAATAESATSPLPAGEQQRPSASVTLSAPRNNNTDSDNNNSMGGAGTAKRTPASSIVAGNFASSSTTVTVIANDSLTASSAANAARLISPTTDARFLGKLLRATACAPTASAPPQESARCLSRSAVTRRLTRWCRCAAPSTRTPRRLCATRFARPCKATTRRSSCCLCPR